MFTWLVVIQILASTWTWGPHVTLHKISCVCLVWFKVCVPLSKQQCRPGLCIIKSGRWAADDHGSPTVPSQGVLQDPGHLTVSVWYICLTEDTNYNPCRASADNIGSFITLYFHCITSCQNVWEQRISSYKTHPPACDDCLTEPSAKAEMTFPSEDRDLLIILASSSTVPSAPVLPTFETQINTGELAWH